MKSLTDLTPKQQRAVDRLYEHDRTILIGNTGLGKTVICLTAMAELIKDGVIKRAVVACPAKVVSHWPKEAAKWDHLRDVLAIAVDGPASVRERLIQSEVADIFVVSLNNLEWFLEQDHGCDGIIIDELSKASGKQTTRLHNKKENRERFKWRVGMTGTPVSENFEKLFKQVRVVDDGKALGRSFEKYRQQFFMPDFNGYNWTLREGSEAAILSKIEHLVYLVKDEKEQELPPLTERLIEFDMPDATLAKYKQMKKDFIVDDVAAVNEAVKSGKLRQIASGFLYEAQDSVLVYDIERFRQAQQWVFDLKGRKGVIFFEYETQGQMLMDMVGTTDDIEAFKAGKHQILVRQINSTSHGVDGLQEVCHDLLFYHPIWSRDAYEQGRDRIWRTGQTKPVTCAILVCRQSLDPLVLQRVEGKGEWMKLFKAHLREN